MVIDGFHCHRVFTLSMMCHEVEPIRITGWHVAHRYMNGDWSESIQDYITDDYQQPNIDTKDY